MVLICISLIISKVEHPVMCLLTICVSSLKEYLFRFSDYLDSVVCFFFPSTELHEPLYILVTNPLSVTFV